jgi:hypothetical protein
VAGSTTWKASKTARASSIWSSKAFLYPWNGSRVGNETGPEGLAALGKPGRVRLPGAAWDQVQKPRTGAAVHRGSGRPSRAMAQSPVDRPLRRGPGPGPRGHRRGDPPTRHEPRLNARAVAPTRSVASVVHAGPEGGQSPRRSLPRNMPGSRSVASEGCQRGPPRRPRTGAQRQARDGLGATPHTDYSHHADVPFPLSAGAGRPLCHPLQEPKNTDRRFGEVPAPSTVLPGIGG